MIVVNYFATLRTAFFFCVSETPEGQAVGVVKNLSMNCEVTDGKTSETSRYCIKEYITTFESVDVYTFNKVSQIKVFINGDWIGFTDQPKKLVDKFKESRTSGLINFQNSIYWDISNHHIQIYSDSGRPIRPLFPSSFLNNLFRRILQYRHES